MDRTKTLEQLENVYWGEPEYPSQLVINCHKYRKIPLGQMKPEHLRLLIGQNISLEYLIPIALEILLKNPLAEGDFYPGDLLKMVLTSEKTYWDKNKDNLKLLKEICQKVVVLLDAHIDNKGNYRKGKIFLNKSIVKEIKRLVA